MAIIKLTTQDCYDAFRQLYMERSQRFFDPTWAVWAITEAVDAIDADIADANPEVAGMISANLSYTSQQQEVDLPEGFQETGMVEVTDRGGPPWPRLSPARFTDRSGVLLGPLPLSAYGGGYGEPREYYIRSVDPAYNAFKLGWLPIPNRTAAANVLFWYHGFRTRVTALGSGATDYPDIPVALHMCIPRKMCVLAAIIDGQKTEYFTGLYNSVLEPRIAQLIRGVTEEGSEQIPVTDEDFLY